MFKSLRTKIFFSFLLLVLMLLTAGVMSILEFRNVGNSVSTVLKNNYQSVESAKVMLDALEREDSGILMWMLDETEEGEASIHASDSIMKAAIQTAKENITEKNEDIYIADIIKHYEWYSNGVFEIIRSNADMQENKAKYSGELATHFANTRVAINGLMNLNQGLIYEQSNKMINNSQRAMMPAIISVIAAILFAVLLNFFISIFFINPVHRLINEIKVFYPEKGTINARITSDDEIKTLENEINSLITSTLRNNKP